MLHTRVADAVRSAVDAGHAPSADAFIEDAIVAALRDQRRARLYAAYAQAAQDPDFAADMTDTTRAFDAVLHDRTDARE